MDKKARGVLWALVLSGGDGTRLQALTRLIAGAPIPKQYCRILGEHSLLEATLARVAQIVPRERTLALINHDHLPLACAQVETLPPGNVVIQPSNRDTGPGVALGVLRVAQRDPDGFVAVFPSDHFIRRQDAFVASFERMQRVLAREPEKIVLLGIQPSHPDPGFGYVVPDRRKPHSTEGSLVKRFEEKPAPPRAAEIIRDGALWSSFIMLFRIRRMLEMLQTTCPYEMAAMKAATADPVTCDYRGIEAWNFSHDVLARRAQDLIVVPADELGWSDWGTPRAIAKTVTAMGLTPAWLHSSAVDVSA